MKISQETKVGILTTLAIVIVILGINFLKGKNVFSRNIILYAEYPNVDGLSPSNPVMLYGLKVGQVDNLELINEAENKIRVKFHIAGNVNIPTNTTAKIISSDLLGSKAIDLIPGNGNVVAEKNDTLKGELEMSLTQSINKVVAPVKEKVESLITSVDTIVTTLNDVFNEDTKQNLRTSFRSIKNSLANIETTTNNVNVFVGTETTRMRMILDNVNSISENIRKNNSQITRIINNFSTLSDTLAALNFKKTIDQANLAMSNLNDVIIKIKNGEGSAGKLLNDEALYKNLQNASKNLDRLMIDLKSNPSRYLNFSIIHINRKAAIDTTK